MAIDFPASPTNGQTFTSGSVTYTYDGTKWTALASGGGATDKIEEGNTSAEVIDTGSDGRFVVTTEGSERLRCDSSGRLLVGTSTTSEVNRAIFQGNSTLSTGTGIVNISLGNSSPGSTDELGRLQFTDSTHISAAQITGQRDSGTWSASSKPTRLVFSTTADGASSPTERMRITSAGGLLTGATVPISVGGVSSVHNFVGDGSSKWAAVVRNTASSTPYGLAISYYGASPNNTDSDFLYCIDSVAERAKIRSNGGLANFSANNVNLSDRNLKKDISLAAGTWDCLKAWEIVNYRYKDQPDDADLNMGVIAQQIAESCPEVITVFQAAKQATKGLPAQEERIGVKEQQMVWMAIKALQEAMERIEQLEAKVNTLEGN